MAGKKGYQRNQAGWDALALGPDIADAVMSRARDGKRIAETIAPRGRTRHGRRYAESFEVRAKVMVLPSDDGVGPRRAADLVNTAPHAAAVEFGNQQTPRGHRTLGKTAALLAFGIDPPARLR